MPDNYNKIHMKTKFLKLLLSLTCMLGASAANAQVFYKIEGNGLNAPSYLFGTHHLAPAEYVQKFSSLPAAMESTVAVVGEIDMTGNQMQLQMDMAPYMMAPQDSTLSKLLSPEEFNILNEQFKPLAPMPGMDLTMLDMMRPMIPMTMATLTLVQKSMPGFDPNNQLDASFQKKYKAAGKKIVPLETVKQQAELLYCTTPIAKQLEGLKEFLADPEKGEKAAMAMNEAYMNQDLEGLLKVSEEDESDPAFMLALLDRRNHDWMTRLPGIMAEQPSLIVVGAAHLAGEEGLVNLLRKAGYTVTPQN